MKPSPPPRRARRRRLVALTAAVMAGLTTLVVPATQSHADGSAYLRQNVQWGPCSWYSSEYGAPVPECATVKVPRDWRAPGQGADLSIAISRVKATDTAHRKGILFTNPGGPGGIGVTLSWGIGRAQPKVAAQYDVIGMDPRGVGFSTQLTCQVDVDAINAMGAYDSRDLSAPAIQGRHTALKALADGCARNPLTPYINTWQTTHDMDLIRALLGERKLNYVGYSYGTWLGAKYAALFPDRSGKIVLDSNTEWTGDMASAWETMPMAFQRRWEKQFVPWANRSKIFSSELGTTPAQVNSRYEEVRSAYAKYLGSPSGDVVDVIIRSSLYTDTGFLSIGFNIALLKKCLVDNPDWSGAAVNQCARDYITWLLEQLEGTPAELTVQEQSATALLTHPEKALDLVKEGPLQSIQAEARNATGDTLSFGGAFYAVRCGDGGNWHNTQWWENRARRDGPRYPLGGYALTNEVCTFWSLPEQELPNPDPHRLGPLLTVQSEFDPATAYELALATVRRYKGQRLIAVQDSGIHGQYGVRGNGCVDDLVNAYLLDDVVPPAHSVCSALPLLFEKQVYPAAGPMDGMGQSHPSRADRVPDRVKREADRIIR